jgi:hypothetical protein
VGVVSQPTTRRREGRPRANQGDYAGTLWQVPVLVTVKAPSWREALRRVGAIGVELVEGTGVDASDLWVRSFVIQKSEGTSGRIAEHAAGARAAATV